MCILLYVKIAWCIGISQIYGLLEGGYICQGYMCILLYVKLIQCSGITQIYGQLDEEGLGISAFCHMSYCPGVVVLSTYGVHWGG